MMWVLTFLWIIMLLTVAVAAGVAIWCALNGQWLATFLWVLIAVVAWPTVKQKG